MAACGDTKLSLGPLARSGKLIVSNNGMPSKAVRIPFLHKCLARRCLYFFCTIQKILRFNFVGERFLLLLSLGVGIRY